MTLSARETSDVLRLTVTDQLAPPQADVARLTNSTLAQRTYQIRAIEARDTVAQWMAARQQGARKAASARADALAAQTAAAQTAAAQTAAAQTPTASPATIAFPTATPQPPAPAPAASASASASVSVSSTASASRPSSPQQIAKAMLGSFGWSSSQFSCLRPLWAHESGWRVSAYNASSGAYGIPQALPGSKMASAGPGWRTNAATQIKWGLKYIKRTYGSPCAASAHEQATGWY